MMGVLHSLCRLMKSPIGATGLAGLTCPKKLRLIIENRLIRLRLSLITTGNLWPELIFLYARDAVIDRRKLQAFRSGVGRSLWPLRWRRQILNLELNVAEIFDDQVDHHLETLFSAAHRRPPLASNTKMIGASTQIAEQLRKGQCSL